MHDCNIICSKATLKLVLMVSYKSNCCICDNAVQRDSCVKYKEMARQHISVPESSTFAKRNESRERTTPKYTHGRRKHLKNGGGQVLKGAHYHTHFGLQRGTFES